MKKLLFILSLLLFFVLNSCILKGQDIGVGTSWTYNVGYFDWPTEGAPKVFSISVIKDSIIDGRKYYELGSYRHCGGPSLKYIRIDGQQWYCYHNGADHLLYDFSLEQGDTLRVWGLGDNVYMEDSLYIRIDSVSNLVIDGVDMKVQHIGFFEGGMDWGTRFIEHVGSDELLSIQDGVCDPVQGGLVCAQFSDGVNLKFSNQPCTGQYKSRSFLVGSKWVYQPWSYQPWGDTETIEVIANVSDGHVEMVRKDNTGAIIEGSEIKLYSYLDGKVYFVMPNGTKKLWFDFSYSNEVGDTIAYYLPPNINMYDFESGGSFEVTDKPYYYKILEIDSVLSDEGKFLRRWIVDQNINVDEDLENCNELYEIIEGVGSMLGFRIPCTRVLGGFPAHFRCFSSYSFDYNRLEVGETCETVGVNDVVTNSIQLFPNPVNRVMYLGSSIIIDKIEVYDLSGKLIYLSDSKVDFVDFRDMNNGVYIVKILDNQGRWNSQRVVKMDY